MAGPLCVMAPVELHRERSEHYAEEIFWETLEDAVRWAAQKLGGVKDHGNLGLWGALDRLTQHEPAPPWLKVKFAEIAVLLSMMPELEKRGANITSLRRLAGLLGFECRMVCLGDS